MSIELEIAGFGIDAILFETTAPNLLLMSRSPAPDEEDVRADTLFRFDIVDTTGGSPDLGNTDVYVSIDGGAESQIYDGSGSGFQAGWAGSASATSTPYTGARRFVIETTLGPFSSLVVVTLRVVSTNGTDTLDESYSFTIEDLTAPVLQSATAIGKKTVRAVFDEALTIEDPTADDDALNPANYVIDRLNVFPNAAAYVTVLSVTRITQSEVDLELDIEMTHGAPYRLQVTGVADAFGNEIVAPFNFTEFDGYTPPFPTTRRFDYWRHMTARTDRDADTTQEFRAFASVKQDIIDLLLCEIDEWTDIIDPDKAPEIFVDAMLVDMGNPFEFDLTLEDKRRLVRVLVPIYKQKGTSVGIVNVVRFFLGLEVVVNSLGSEGWTLGEDELGETTFLAPGSQFNLYAFEILVPVAISAEIESKIRGLATYMKSAHTHLVRIVDSADIGSIDHIELGLSELGTEEWILH